MRCRFRVKRDHLTRGDLNAEQESGRDCLTCAGFAPQRWLSDVTPASPPRGVSPEEFRITSSSSLLLSRLE